MNINGSSRIDHTTDCSGVILNSSENLQTKTTSMNKSKPKKKHHVAIIKDRINDISIACEWNVCSSSIKNMRHCLLHVAEHVATVDTTPTNDGFICLWRKCGFISYKKEELDRHIYFHVFHSRIKAVGDVLMNSRNLKCSLDELSCNVIPDLPEPFVCAWDSCGFKFVSAQEFYWHTQSHAKAVYEDLNKKSKENSFLYECDWQDCKIKAKVSQRLIDHVRTHTKEKVAACPTCGSIFSSYSKLYDHCYRNLGEEHHRFECSHCKSKFTTEGLLREHIRTHVNQLKCPQCEMTCPSKSTMENHIRYKHTNNKPFKCPQCDKRFKVQSDVIKHLVVHSTERNFQCPFPDCSYSCRSYTSILLHEKRVHQSMFTHPYLCQICEQKFTKGSLLTCHLKKEHSFHWPAGHSRFRYCKDEDGYYKLQTTRIEILDLAEEIMNEEAERNPDEPRLQIHFEEEEGSAAAPPQSPGIGVAEPAGEGVHPDVKQPDDQPIAHLAGSCHYEGEKFLQDFLPHPPQQNEEITAVPAIVLHDSSQFTVLNYNEQEEIKPTNVIMEVVEFEPEEYPSKKRLKFSAF